MPLFTCPWSDIRAAAHRGIPFCVRYEYSGYNGANASGHSNKFWCYERTTQDGPIHVRYGKIGTVGQVRNRGLSFSDACLRANNKVAKGYRQVAMLACRKKALPPLSEWAAALPAPFNEITSIDADNNARNAQGLLVVTMSAEEADRVRAQYFTGA